MPTVTVLMPVYNAEKYLRPAIESILRQTYRDFSFLLLDDCSRDQSWPIMQSYNDARIRLVHNATNLGLAQSLNKGIGLADSKYIARMDNDDISLPNRLARQVAFMEAHPTIGICGAAIRTFGEGMKPQNLFFPCHPQVLHCSLLFTNNIAHPTSIFNRELLERHSLLYDASFRNIEDYEMWVRCARYFPIANLKQILLLYRKHPEQLTKNKNWVSYYRMVSENQLKELAIGYNSEDLAIYHALKTGDFYQTEDFPVKAVIFLEKIIQGNHKTHTYDQAILYRELGTMWWHICNFGVKRFGHERWQAFRSSLLGHHPGVNFVKLCKFASKCLLRWSP
jgi:glycosyltransferase involved in cell wall biosynthesis